LTRIAVHDSSVLIDLSNGDLFEAYLLLGYETLTTDFIVREVSKDSQPIAAWLQAHATITHYTPSEMLALKQRQLAVGSSISLEDASALYLAKDIDALLLTNDQRLRQVAKKLDVQVGGILLLMDALHTQRLLSGQHLTASLDAILGQGARLPADACAERRRKWQAK
jgi:predicted nucleic acid-binding protein